MKSKKIMLIMLLLTVLTIGAVSAADDADNLTADNADDAIIAQAADDIDQLQSEQTGADATVSTDEKKDAEHEITIPKSVRTGDLTDDEGDYASYGHAITYRFEDYDLEGDLKIFIDNELKKTVNLGYSDYVSEPGHFELNKLGLGYGTHNVTVRYSGDENYNPFEENGTFELYYMKVHVPEPVSVGYSGDSSIDVIFALDATGKMAVYIDDELYENINNVRSARNTEDGLTDTIPIDLDDFKIDTTHTYKIVYSDGNYDAKTVSGSFNVSYGFKAYLWEDFDEEYGGYDGITYGENVTCEIELIENKGTLNLKLNGKDYPIEILEDDFEYTLPPLAIGENNLTFTYTYKNYKPRQISFKINAVPEITGPEYVMTYGSPEGYVYLKLPDDAKGSLIVYVEKNWEDEQYKSSPMVNGEAKVIISDLEMGYRTVKAKYNGTDYDVEEFYASIDVVANITCPAGISVDSDEDHFATVKCSGDGESNMTITLNDGDSYDLITTLYTGPANKTITVKLPKLDKNVYTIIAKYQYGEYSYNDAYQSFYVTDEDPDLDWELDFPSTMLREYNEHVSIYEIPDEAGGKVALYIDGNLTSEISLSDGSAWFTILTSKLEPGSHTWKIVYYGDGYFNNKTEEGTFEVDDSGSEDYGPNIYIYDADLDDKNNYFVEIFGDYYDVDTVEVIANGTTIFDGAIDDFNYDDEIDSYILLLNQVNYPWAEGQYKITVICVTCDDDTITTTNTITISKSSSDMPPAPIVTPSANVISTSTPSSVVTQAPATTKKADTITLTLKKVTVKKSAKKLVISATLKINGKAAKNKKITFKFNKKTYTAKTNAKGVAKITIKKSALKKLKAGKKVEYQAKYLTKTVKKAVKVKK